MRKVILITSVSLLTACQTAPQGQCQYKFEADIYETVTETVVDNGPTSRALISIPAVMDPVSGEVLVPARTQEPKEQYPLILSASKYRVLKTPAEYFILDKSITKETVLTEAEFNAFQKIHNCKLAKA